MIGVLLKKHSRALALYAALAAVVAVGYGLTYWGDQMGPPPTTEALEESAEVWRVRMGRLSLGMTREECARALEWPGRETEFVDVQGDGPGLMGLELSSAMWVDVDSLYGVQCLFENGRLVDFGPLGQPDE